jgi:hypothetical protein
VVCLLLAVREFVTSFSLDELSGRIQDISLGVQVSKLPGESVFTRALKRTITIMNTSTKRMMIPYTILGASG